jgi:hypothetical protein
LFSWCAARSFTTRSISSTGNAPSGTAAVSISLEPSYALVTGTTITIVGLTGTAQSSTPTLSAPAAGVLTATSWTQLSGTLVLTVGASGVSTGSPTAISFDLANAATPQAAVSGITVYVGTGSKDEIESATMSGTALRGELPLPLAVARCVVLACC